MDTATSPRGRASPGATPCDVAVVGGGIIGLATALALVERFAGLSVVVIEKESDVGQHQTGHNSGVIHSGLYYRPGSAKARLAVRGAEQMLEFCREHDIPHERCGKVVVATDESQTGRLRALAERGGANGVPGIRRESAPKNSPSSSPPPAASAPCTSPRRASPTTTPSRAATARSSKPAVASSTPASRSPACAPAATASASTPATARSRRATSSTAPG